MTVTADELSSSLFSVDVKDKLWFQSVKPGWHGWR